MTKPNALSQEELGADQYLTHPHRHFVLGTATLKKQLPLVSFSRISRMILRRKKEYLYLFFCWEEYWYWKDAMMDKWTEKEEGGGTAWKLNPSIRHGVLFFFHQNLSTTSQIWSHAFPSGSISRQSHRKSPSDAPVSKRNWIPEDSVPQAWFSSWRYSEDAPIVDSTSICDHTVRKNLHLRIVEVVLGDAEGLQHWVERKQEARHG